MSILHRETVTMVGKEAVAVGTQAASMVRAKLIQGSHIAARLDRATLDLPDESPLRWENPARVHGLKTGTWGPISWHWRACASGDRLSAGGTANSARSQHLLMEHGLGRIYAALGCTIGTGSDTNTLVVDSTADRRAGEVILVEVSSGNWEPNVVSSVTNGTTMELKYVLSGSPTNGLGVRGGYTFLLAETRNTTLSLEQRHVDPSQNEEYRVLGAFGNFKLALPDAYGQKIVCSLDGAGCSSWEGPTTLTSNAFSGTSAPADSDMGEVLLHSPIVKIADTVRAVEKVAIEIMSKADPIPRSDTQTGVNGFIDVAGRDGGQIVKVSLTVEFDRDDATTFDAGTVVSFFAVFEGASGGWGVIEVPRMELIERPKPVSIGGGRLGAVLVGNALRDTLTPASASAERNDLAYAPLRVAVL